MALLAKEQELQAVIREVRTCFNQLKTLAEGLHQDLGVNPSMRAVMESLSTGDRQTVPDIANAKGVSRQHIQTIMNALSKAGFVESFDNPAHKRSPLFSLTARGQSTFEEVREREKEPFQRLSEGLPLSTLQQARKNLRQLNQRITNELSKGDNNGTFA